MANKSVFPRARSNRRSGQRHVRVPATDTRNKSGSPAYSFTAEHQLAQLAVTGTFAGTAYSSPQEQLQAIQSLSNQVSAKFLAQLAIYARQKGYMKDMPAALAVILSMRDPQLLDLVFDRVIDNGRMVRNFVQMIRSGALGRKSLGSGPKRLIKRWFRNRDGYRLFRDSVGNDPSLADVIKLVHPQPETAEKRALYGYLLGREYDSRALPEVVQHFEDFKKGKTTTLPDVDFRQLTSLGLTQEQWAEVARRGKWHQTRMNLNTYARHGVFDIPGMADTIADKLRDADEVRKARVFPYQLMSAYTNINNAPHQVVLALQDAMEVAIENIPDVNGRVLVFPDVSASMSSPVTGYRQQATTNVRCRDVAALVSSAFLRKNRNTLVLPFHNRVEQVKLNPYDSVMTNAEILRRLPSGGTNCSAPLAWCNKNQIKADLVLYVSDNESWVDSKGNQRGYGSRGTATMDQYQIFKRRNPNAKMVCLDLSPRSTTIAPDAPNSVMNIGGFSDQVFTVIRDFYEGRTQDDAQVWVKEIKKIRI